MLKWVGIMALVLAAIVVSKLPVSILTDICECGGKVVSWAGEQVTEGSAWVAGRVREEKRETGDIYAVAVKGQMAPVIAAENQRVMDAVSQSGSAMAEVANRQIQILDSISVTQGMAMAENRAEHGHIVEDLGQAQAGIDRVRRDVTDSARLINSMVWVITADGTSRQCRLVPAREYTESMGPILERRVIGGNEYRLVLDVVLDR